MTTGWQYEERESLDDTYQAIRQQIEQQGAFANVSPKRTRTGKLLQKSALPPPQRH